MLHTYDDCLKSKRAYAENFRHIEEQSNRWQGDMLIEPFSDAAYNNLPSSLVSLPPLPAGSVHRDGGYVIVEPANPPMTTAEADRSYDLPYTRLPHPKYAGKSIPAFDMIRFSVNMHRGCFGGCSFCTISAHQGKQVVSRSKESIIQEVRKVAASPDFKGYLSDLGGPSANMYGMHGKDMSLCKRCKRPTCLQPAICPNLNQDFESLIDIYRSVDELPQIKKSFIGSGIRYDLMSERYAREVITRHVSGRLKVAPEHTEDSVLRLMR